MTLVRRPSPFSELVTLRQAMDRLFDDRMFRPFDAVSESFGRLPLDVRSTGDALLPKAEQVKPRQIRISPVTSGSTVAPESPAEGAWGTTTNGGASASTEA